MNRRNFLKSSAALTVCSTVLNTKAFANSPLAAGPANVWARPLHFVYPIQGANVSVPPTDAELLAAFDLVPGGLTALTPFLLNVKNPSQYSSMINAVQARGIIFNPGVGGPAAAGPLYTPGNQAIAAGYRNYTSYIRLENTQGFYQNPGGQADIQSMIDYCVSLGFEHIMLNPWPLDGNGNVVPFTNPELDASFNQVMLDFNHSTYVVTPDSRNWMVNTNQVGAIQAYRPSINIVINYESEPQHEALYDLELNHPGSSIAAMNITATECQNSTQGWHWAPPFTHVYDPLALGTWPWIANQLGDQLNAPPTPGSIDLQTSMALTATGTGYSATLKVTNMGAGVAQNVTVTSATLGSAAGTTLPVVVGDLQSNQSVSVTLTFPASAGAPNSRAVGQIAGVYSGGNFGGTMRTILP